MQNFTALGLPRPLLQALEKMKFEKPTPIQAQAIPPALEGRDVLGSAQTGTGKTAAFVIPMLTHLLQPADPHHRSPSMAIVMTPTRELAMQVFDAVKTLLAYAPPHLRAALLIGGQSMGGQLRQLRDRPRIIIGTPGRINDHLQQRTLFLATADFLVLDETDRMLDMGFGPQIDRIVKTMPKKRQTLLFSATLPPHIVKVSEQYLHQPVRVAVGPVNQAVPKIRQELVHLQIAEKFDRLVKEISTRSGSIIVFVKTKRGADRIADKLNKSDLGAVAIHGNLNQNQRNRVIQSFRDMKHRVLIATDVASRGLDIPHIEHVVNYDLPQVAEDYIHRIGRTARAGKEGDAVCFITPEDSEMWREIHKLLHPNAAPLPPSDRKPIKKGGGGQHRTCTPEEKARIGRNRTGFEHRKARKGGADGNDGNRRNAGGDRPQRDDRPPREERPYRGDRPQGQRNDRPQGQRNDRPQGRRDDRPRFDRGQGYAGGRDSDYFEPRGERSSRDHDDNPRQYRNDRRHERGARSGETVGAGASQRDDRGGYGKKPRGSFESRGARQGDRQRGGGFGGGSRDGQRGGYSANSRSEGRSGGRSGDSRGGFRKGSGGGRKRDTRG